MLGQPKLLLNLRNRKGSNVLILSRNLQPRILAKILLKGSRKSRRAENLDLGTERLDGADKIQRFWLRLGALVQRIDERCTRSNFLITLPNISLSCVMVGLVSYFLWDS